MRAAPIAVLVVVLAGCGGGSHTSSGALPVETINVPTRTVTYSVPSSSMEPTLHCAQPGSECKGGALSDGAVTQEPVKNLKRGAVVVFQTPPLAETRCGAGGKFVSRVIGLAGERWAEKNGFIYIDGKKLEEPYIEFSRRDSRTIAPSFLVRLARIRRGHSSQLDRQGNQDRAGRVADPPGSRTGHREAANGGTLMATHEDARMTHRHKRTPMANHASACHAEGREFESLHPL
jgi:hypothetical protein